MLPISALITEPKLVFAHAKSIIDLIYIYSLHIVRQTIFFSYSYLHICNVTRKFAVFFWWPCQPDSQFACEFARCAQFNWISCLRSPNIWKCEICECDARFWGFSVVCVFDYWICGCLLDGLNGALVSLWLFVFAGGKLTIIVVVRSLGEYTKRKAWKSLVKWCVHGNAIRFVQRLNVNGIHSRSRTWIRGIF